MRRALQIGLGALIGTVGIGAAIRPPPAPPAPPIAGMLVAHRAGLAHAPENSLAAIRGAARAGADAIELDVRRGPGGRIACAHDAHQVSDGPALADALALAVALGLWVELDLKGGISGRALVHDVVQIVAEHGASDRVWISAFSPLTLWWVRRAAPSLPVGWPMTPVGLPLVDAWIAWDGPARWMGASLLEPRADLATDTRLARWAARGWPVEVWVVHDRDRIAALRSRAIAVVVDRIP